MPTRRESRVELAHRSAASVWRTVTDNLSDNSLPPPISHMYNIIAMLQVPRARWKPLLPREGERKREIRLDYISFIDWLRTCCPS